jgi:hypothetical protein
MTDFLPKDYETPEIPGHFMELEEGTNTFRVLASAIVGYKWWVDDKQEGRKPVRVRTADDVPEEVKNTTDWQAQARHFWAFPVYNYRTKSIQILEIKQQKIMRAIEAFVKNPKWGNPQRYDLIIEKVKTGSRDRDVEYHVIPEPPTPLDAGIVELAKNVPVNLEALFTGDDPFAEPDEAGEQEHNGKHARETAARRVHAAS